jgi:hypothetical protein
VLCSVNVRRLSGCFCEVNLEIISLITLVHLCITPKDMEASLISATTNGVKFEIFALPYSLG